MKVSLTSFFALQVATVLLSVGLASAEVDCSTWAFPNDYEVNCPKDATPEDLAKKCCFLTPPMTRITAKEAFVGYQKQSIQGHDNVLMIDVRTPEEIFWTGQVAQVNKITMIDGTEIVPDNYMVTLNPFKEKPTLKWSIGKKVYKENVDDIQKLDMSPVSFNVPVEFIDSTSGVKSLNEDIGVDIQALVDEYNPSAVIFYCRSGKRSTTGCYYGYCKEMLASLMPLAIYEVEKTDGTDMGEINGHGGYEGSSYQNRYNGYRGFPGRLTTLDKNLAVDFKDLGLPITIGTTPLTLDDSSGHVPPFGCTSTSTHTICQN